MKHVSRRAFLAAALLHLPSISHTQLLEENFSYTAGSLLTANGYSAHSGGGATPLTVSAGSLVRSGYPSSGIGNSVLVTGGSGSREDVNRTFPSITSGSVYASFLVSVTSMSQSGDYFFHLAPTAVSTIFRGRVLAKSDSSGQLAFGVSKSASADSLISWTPFSYAKGTTYLLILKYTFNGASTSDDEVRLWVNPSSSTTEPAPNLVHTDNGSDVSEVGSYVLRQGSVSYSVTIDGIRISTAWSNARLPLHLEGFSASEGPGGMVIMWTTVTETNTYGFEVQKSTAGTGDFQSISEVIPGHGTTTTPHSYSFTDTSLSRGGFYRLKEIDLDQSVYYSDPIEAGLTSVDGEAPKGFVLYQNYPNPFNPSTRIHFLLVNRQSTVVKVFDLLGREVATLVNEVKQPGSYDVLFDATGLAGGVYFCLLESGSRREVRRMVLLR